MRQPKRKAIEPGVYIRVNDAGDRCGDTFEIAWKDAQRRSQRRGGFRTISDARDALHKAKARRVDRVREPARTRLTFAAVAEQWKAAEVAALRPATQAVYGAALGHLLPELGRRRMDAITSARVKEYARAKSASGLAGWTIASHLTVISAVFTFAIRDLGFPGLSPTAGLRRGDRPDRARGGMRIVNDDELGRLLDCAPADHRLYLAVLAQTGMRKSEALGLVWDDVGEDTLRVHYQRDRRTGERVELKNSKSSHARRTVVVTPGLIAALREHRIASPRSQRFDYIFASTDYHAVDRAWSTTRKAAGFGKLEHDGRVVVQAMRLHDLRHSHVSSLIAEGWDVVRVAARIGDTIATVQETYAHLFDSARYAEAERASLARYDTLRGRDGTQFTPGMAPTDSDRPQQPPIAPAAEVADLRAVRDRAQ
jgi:integrase